MCRLSGAADFERLDCKRHASEIIGKVQDMELLLETWFKSGRPKVLQT
jgi:hypothetical protein